ncbi:MAG: nitroreductase family protein [Nanoarchaeota archaeon]
MEFDSVIQKRRSVRSFKSKKPDWKDILQAIDSALQSPFAGNHNNLKFIIIEDPEKISKIAEFSEQKWILESKTLVAVCSDNIHLKNLYGERGRIYSRQQAGATIQTFLLKLINLGISACWVGAYTDKLIKELLKIPAHIQIEAVIPVGYEKEKSPHKRKKTLESSIFWEEWDKNKKPVFIKSKSPCV